MRAKRRYLELLSRGQEADEESIYKQILERDEQDSKREFAPLKKADDAVVVDTSEKSIEEVADTISAAIDEKLAKMKAEEKESEQKQADRKTDDQNEGTRKKEKKKKPTGKKKLPCHYTVWLSVIFPC